MANLCLIIPISSSEQSTPFAVLGVELLDVLGTLGALLGIELALGIYLTFEAIEKGCAPLAVVSTGSRRECLA
jgi:hypothetical protein